MQVRTGFAPSRAVCLPFTDECRPLVRNAADLQRAITEARERVQGTGCGTIEVRADIAGHDGEPVGPVQYFGHLLELQETTDALLRRFHPSIRQGVRKAERSGLSVTFPESEEGVRLFYRLQCSTRRRHGLPPQPVSLFLNIHREFIKTGRGFISMVSNAGSPIAAVFFLLHGTRATYKFGASLPEGGCSRANTLAMWHAILRCRDSGISRIDFGRTDATHPGLRAYKLRWGTREYPIRYARYDRLGRRLPPRKVATQGLHNAFFRIMPSPVSRLIGTFLYRYMG